MGEAETYLGEKWEDYRGGWSCSSVAAREGGGEMKRGRKTGERSEGTGSVAEKERRRGAGSKSDGPAGGPPGRRTRKGSKRFQRNLCHSNLINAWLRVDYLLHSALTAVTGEFVRLLVHLSALRRLIVLN